MKDSPNARALEASVPGADTPDIEGLRDFALGTDRGAPSFFAGRSEEIADVSSRLGLALRMWRKGEAGAWEGRTMLIQGAPGAGKTALLRHLGETLPSEIGGLRVCRLESELLHAPGYWVSGIGTSLAPQQWGKISKSISKSTGFSVGVPGVAGTGGSVSSEKAALAGYEAWGELARLLREELRKERGAVRPVLLLIDEVQNVPGEKNEPSPGGAFLSIVHKAIDGLPVFPIYGGLAWSSGRLSIPIPSFRRYLTNRYAADPDACVKGAKPSASP